MAIGVAMDRSAMGRESGVPDLARVRNYKLNLDVFSMFPSEDLLVSEIIEKLLEYVINLYESCVSPMNLDCNWCKFVVSFKFLYCINL
jgi:hypothetical protein